MSSHTKDVYVKHPAAMRWTHIALPATNIDKTIDWYTPVSYTHLTLPTT